MKERIYFLIAHFYTLSFLSKFFEKVNGIIYYDWVKQTFISDFDKKK